MNKAIDERLVIVDSDNEFSFKKNKSNLNISFNRSAFIFFCFLIIVLLFSIKVFYFASISDKNKSITILNNDFRADIIDRNGEFLAKSVITNNIGIDPKLINTESVSPYTVFGSIVYLLNILFNNIFIFFIFFFILSESTFEVIPFFLSFK